MTKASDTSYSLPILPVDKYKKFISDNNLYRFSALKIKLDRDLIVERVSAVKDCFSQNIFIDFNEAFSSFNEIEPYVRFFNEKEVKVIEQPFKEGSIEENIKVKRVLSGDLFLDEDFTDKDLPINLREFCDGVNFKIQKKREDLAGHKSLLIVPSLSE